MEANMHTKDLLAAELEKAGLHEMAIKARQGHYHDYLSPLDTPDLELEFDLLAAVTAGNMQAQELRMRHHNGEFDASIQESDEWMDSPEGKAAVAGLARPK